MCLLCDDEASYKAYMDYLDAMERQGKSADPDKAMDEVLDQMAREAADRNDPPPFVRAAPSAAKFSCDPVDE